MSESNAAVWSATSATIVSPINQLRVQEGEQADSFWVLLDGGRATIQALDDHGKRLTSTISHGHTFFCETALLGEVSQESSVEAMLDSEWLRLHWSDFQRFNDEEDGDIRTKLEIITEKLQEMESQKKQQKHSGRSRVNSSLSSVAGTGLHICERGFLLSSHLLSSLDLAYLGNQIAGSQWWIIIPTVFLFFWRFESLHLGYYRLFQRSDCGDQSSGCR